MLFLHISLPSHKSRQQWQRRNHGTEQKTGVFNGTWLCLIIGGGQKVKESAKINWRSKEQKLQSIAMSKKKKILCLYLYHTECSQWTTYIWILLTDLYSLILLSHSELIFMCTFRGEKQNQSSLSLLCLYLLGLFSPSRQLSLWVAGNKAIILWLQILLDP